jgi:hypothetical protein
VHPGAADKLLKVGPRRSYALVFSTVEKADPSEYAVLVVFISAVFVIFGVIALVVGFRAPAEKHALAVALEVRGAWCLGIGVAIGFGFWLFHRIVD